MNKDIRKAIDENRTMYWEWAPLNHDQPLDRYQLRAETGRLENGTVITRRLFASLEETKADRLHREIVESGIPVYDRAEQVPFGISALVGTPARARSASVAARLALRDSRP